MSTDPQSGTQLPYVFFFVGHFNEVDHMIPIAYKLCESGRGRPVILVVNPFYDHADDYRLRFLQEKYGVQVTPVWRFHPVSPILGWLASLLGLPLWRGFQHYRHPIFFRALRRLFYTRRWTSGVLDRYRPAALVFEWKNPTSGLTGAFVSEGHARDIPAFSVPHGVWIWTNELINEVERVQGPVGRNYQNVYSRAVYENCLHGDRAFSEGVSADKIAVLGSVRFCREWQALNLDIQPRRFIPQKGVGCTFKVVFMLPKRNLNTDSDMTMQTLRRLAAEPWLHLVLKPHTRETKTFPSYLKEFKGLPNMEVAGEYGSVALIQWADATIAAGASIALEALLQGKHHLDAAYLMDNTTLFQDTGAEWRVNNEEELVDALKRLSQGEPPPYGEKEVSRVIEQMVTESPTGPGVLGRYVDFILGGWKEYPSYKPSPKTSIHPLKEPAAVALEPND